MPSTTTTDIVSDNYVIFIRGRMENHIIYHPVHESYISGHIWAIQVNNGH